MGLENLDLVTLLGWGNDNKNKDHLLSELTFIELPKLKTSRVML